MLLARIVARRPTGAPWPEGSALSVMISGAGEPKFWNGSRVELEAWCKAEGSSALGGALARLLASLSPPPPLTLRARRFDFGEKTWLMGVVNVTPDSFSDGGRFSDTVTAIEHGVQLVDAGAHLLDVGGESTRPGALPVSLQEECRRVTGVIAGLRRACPDTPISIDTSKAAVAAAAIEAGASMINDVTALGGDPQMASVAAEADVALCLMHMQGTPRTMQAGPRYGDVVAEVLNSLNEAIERARAAGVRREQIVVDPGIGFGKTPGHNLWLLNRLGDFRLLGCPVLVGTSRKSFLGVVTGATVPEHRDGATAATVAIVAAMGSADFVRIHDPASAKAAAAVGDAVRTAMEAGERFAL